MLCSQMYGAIDMVCKYLEHLFCPHTYTHTHSLCPSNLLVYMCNNQIYHYTMYTKNIPPTLYMIYNYIHITCDDGILSLCELSIDRLVRQTLCVCVCRNAVAAQSTDKCQNMFPEISILISNACSMRPHTLYMYVV